ncbi:hypothetical protein [Leptolyngbya ohadii]|uniref:hypothetical protein n=1 Tax=Leptolyngbya ohadii TaxID=1962290 RepID=UPI000B5995CC|nr:hypothetical protein [Leptolyngbya ohadii]
MSQSCPITEQLFVGDSEMAALMQLLDWSQLPLGSVETWSKSLRTSLSICLMSRFPVLIWWELELVMFYNDAYRPILEATKHPKALGQKGAIQDETRQVGSVFTAVTEKTARVISERRLAIW